MECNVEEETSVRNFMDLFYIWPDREEYLVIIEIQYFPHLWIILKKQNGWLEN